MSYPQATQDAADYARRKEVKTTRDTVLLALFEDGGWMSSFELAKRSRTMRFGARLWDLRHHEGVEWECRLDPDRPKGTMWYQYRLKQEEGCCCNG